LCGGAHISFLLALSVRRMRSLLRLIPCQ
jgi:hypothetical protein